MMLDTLKLVSPFLEADIAEQIDQVLDKHRRIDMTTGEITSITRDIPVGSHDHRVSVRLHTDRLVARPPSAFEILRSAGKRRCRTSLTRETCPPYLIIEGSVHKLILGHNIAGGPDDFLATCRYFVQSVGDMLGAILPPADQWAVTKVDWAEGYDIGLDAVRLIVSAASGVPYPRRTVQTYGVNSIEIPGSTTTLKMYAKGPEFIEHDHQRLKSALSTEDLARLTAVANRTLRVETSIHLQRLNRDFGGHPLVSDLTNEYIRSVHHREFTRWLGRINFNSTASDSPINDLVHLCEVYGDTDGKRYFCALCVIREMGEEAARRDFYTKSTWYLHKKALIKAGCSLATKRDGAKRPAILDGFRLDDDDRRRDISIDPAVRKALAPYRNVILNQQAAQMITEIHRPLLAT